MMTPARQTTTGRPPLRRHASAGIGLAAVLLAIAVPAGAQAAAAPTTGAAASASASTQAVPSDVRLVSTRTSLLGTHRLYEQVRAGNPVAGGWYVVHDWSDRAPTTDDLRRDIEETAKPASAARLTGADAVRVAAAGGRVLDRSLAWLVNGDGTARLVWQVTSQRGAVQTVTSVDAADGGVVRQDRDGLGHKTAQGRVFAPNPVVSQQDEGLRDHQDANSAVPFAAYSDLTLRHLDSGTRELHGQWVTIVNKDAAVSTDGEYLFRRANDDFEQVMAYATLDRAQSYLQQLGFTDATGVNAEPQNVATNTFRGDNSFYLPGNDKIVFGSGGVDDAEDEEVVWHEYGHAIQDAQVPGFGQTEQGGAMGEGFGDYWAYTMSQSDSDSTETTPLACIADWDAVSYTSGPTHCLRRVNLDLTVPDDVQHEVHADGRIWARALWDINRDLGRTEANTVIIEAHFAMTPQTKFRSGAHATVQTAQALYGDEAAAVVRQAFVDRGILSDAP